MAAGSTYTPIATTTLGSATNSVTFSSIAGTYTDIVIVMNLGNASSENTAIQFNSDTGTNYSITYLAGDGTSASSGRTTSAAYIRVDSSSAPSTSLNSTHIVNVMNYANSTTYKSTVMRSNTASGGTAATVGLWRSTAAITAIKIYGINSSNLASGSTFTLYGITAA